MNLKQLSITLLLSPFIVSCNDFKSQTPFIDLNFDGVQRTASSLSSKDVTCMRTDALNNLWIGTNDGLNIYDGFKYHQFFHSDNDSTSIPDNNITTLFRSSDGMIWVGTSLGLCSYNENGQFKNYTDSLIDEKPIDQIIETSLQKILIVTGNQFLFSKADNGNWVKNPIVSEQSPKIFQIAADNEGGFWKCTPQTCVHYDKDYKEIQRLELGLPTYNVVQIAKENNKLWIFMFRDLFCIDIDSGELLYQKKELFEMLPQYCYYQKPYVYLKTYKHGLYRLHEETHELQNVSQEMSSMNFFPHLLTCVETDEQGGIFYGFNQKGIIHVNNDNFVKINNNVLFNALYDKNVISLTSSGNGEILAGTDNELFYYNQEGNQIHAIEQNSIFTDSPYFKQTLQKIVPAENSKSYWISTNVRVMHSSVNKGVINIDNSLKFDAFFGDILSLGDSCLVIYPGEGLLMVNKNGNISTIPFQNSKYNTKSHLVKIDDTHAVICLQGLYLFLIDIPNRNVTPLETRDKTSHHGSIPITLAYKNGNLWIGTDGQGVFEYNMTSKILRSINVGQEKHIRGIQPLATGELYVTTRNGLIACNPETNDIIHLNTRFGLLNFEDYSKDCICSFAGNVLLGTRNGILFFTDNYQDYRQTAYLNFKGIEIIGNENKRLRALPKDKDKYIFSHKNNDLELQFGGLNAPSDIAPIYEYKLENYDSRWRTLTKYTNGIIEYTNLLPGSYQFCMRVRKSESSSQNIAEKKVNIIIKPAIWASTTALFLYLALLAFAIWFIIQTRYRIKNSRMQLEMARKDEERERKTNEMNMNFFANIAHEFRNPLAIIAGPISSLNEDTSLPTHAYKKLNVVSQSVNRMLKLIDQMLDFNKLETDVLKLKVAKYDINYEVKKWIELFEESAAYQDIEIRRNLLQTPCLSWLDHDKLDKILSNLFTNALKHTPRNGIIKIDLETLSSSQVKDIYSLKDSGQLHADDYLQISLYNNGPSIESDKLDSVFLRYYQVPNNTYSKHTYGWGTGIGLYYVKKLVFMHLGYIRVYNEPEGGVTFSFVIPLGDTAYSHVDHVDNSSSNIMQMNIPEDKINPANEISDKLNQEMLSDTNRPTLLIVDDDFQVANYIKSLFMDNYQVVCRYSAEDALKEFDEINPDIILSDVIMNKMTGYEFCKKLKDDATYCHIPIILITGKGAVKEQIEGLHVGANAYVPKPFHPSYLQAVVESQMSNLEKLKKSLTESVDVTSVQEGLSPSDKAFMEQLYQFMEDHIADEDMDVPMVSKNLLVSKSKFNYKLKALTGETPVVFFKKFKMNRAAKLLASGKYNVSEVAAMTGFGTLSYFSVSFKKQFGINPSEYK